MARRADGFVDIERRPARLAFRGPFEVVVRVDGEDVVLPKPRPHWTQFLWAAVVGYFVVWPILWWVAWMGGAGDLFGLAASWPALLLLASPALVPVAFRLGDALFPTTSELLHAAARPSSSTRVGLPFVVATVAAATLVAMVDPVMLVPPVAGALAAVAAFVPWRLARARASRPPPLTLTATALVWRGHRVPLAHLVGASPQHGSVAVQRVAGPPLVLGVGLHPEEVDWLVERLDRAITAAEAGSPDDVDPGLAALRGRRRAPAE